MTNVTFASCLPVKNQPHSACEHSRHVLLPTRYSTRDRMLHAHPVQGYRADSSFPLLCRRRRRRRRSAAAALSVDSVLVGFLKDSNLRRVRPVFNSNWESVVTRQQVERVHLVGAQSSLVLNFFSTPIYFRITRARERKVSIKLRNFQLDSIFLNHSYQSSTRCSVDSWSGCIWMYNKYFNNQITVVNE